MASFSLTIDDASNNSVADLTQKVNPTPSDRRREINQLISYLGGVGGGVIDAEVNVTISSGSLASATGTVTCATALAADTVTINGVVFTAVSGTPANQQFDISGNNDAEAASLAAAINGITGSNAALINGFVVASAAGNVVTLRCPHKGILGNAITLASSNGTRLAVSGARLTGGTGGFGTSSTEYNYGV